MKHIIVTQTFKFAHDGCRVEEFCVSDEPRETTDECADVALAEGWAVATEAPDAPAPPATPDAPDARAHAASPETRDAAQQRKTKAARTARPKSE